MGLRHPAHRNPIKPATYHLPQDESEKLFKEGKGKKVATTKKGSGEDDGTTKKTLGQNARALLALHPLAAQDGPPSSAYST